MGCWAHARRKFIDVTKALSKKGSRGYVHEFIELINKLYTIEAKARSDGRTPDQLYEIRQIKSVPILEKIKAKLDDVVLRTPPKGLLGKLGRLLLVERTGCFQVVRKELNLVQVYLH